MSQYSNKVLRPHRSYFTLPENAKRKEEVSIEQAPAGCGRRVVGGGGNPAVISSGYYYRWSRRPAPPGRRTGMHWPASSQADTTLHRPL